MVADLSKLRRQIAALAKKSRVGKRVQDVIVEPDDYGDGTDFLRVVVQLKGIEKVQVEDVKPLVRSIEDLVAQTDDRFPSVRFAEAA